MPADAANEGASVLLGTRVRAWALPTTLRGDVERALSPGLAARRLCGRRVLGQEFKPGVRRVGRCPQAARAWLCPQSGTVGRSERGWWGSARRRLLLGCSRPCQEAPEKQDVGAVM